MFIALGFLCKAVVVASRLKSLQRYEQSKQTQNKKKGVLHSGVLPIKLLIIHLLRYCFNDKKISSIIIALSIFTMPNVLVL